MAGLNDFSGFRQIQAVPFSITEFERLTQNSVGKLPGAEEPSPVPQITKWLTSLGCSSILVEENYVDRDYTSEFCAVYARRFNIPSPRPQRLHFFRTQLSNYNVRIDYEVLRTLKSEDYLGFCVVRPTETQRIGRTVLSGRTADTNELRQHFITCLSSFETHLFGSPFKVSGFPFLQQDTQVSACAHAVLWMVGRHMASLSFCREFSPSDIADLAARIPRGRIYPAESGLTTEQQLSVLHHMGISALCYGRAEIKPDMCAHIRLEPSIDGKPASANDTNSAKLADLCYRYVESRLPVILLTKKHAVVALGHTIGKADTTMPGVLRQIPCFLINDDTFGPYSELPIRKGSSVISFDDVVEIVPILPAGAKLSGEHAEEYARSILEQIESKDPADQEDGPWRQACSSVTQIAANCDLRTYLLRSVEFQNDLSHMLDKELIDREVGKALIQLDYPKYVWISEVYRKSREEVRHCAGVVIIDSTAGKKERAELAVVIDKVFCLFNRRKLDESHPPCLLSKPFKFPTKRIAPH